LSTEKEEDARHQQSLAEQEGESSDDDDTTTMNECTDPPECPSPQPTRDNPQSGIHNRKPSRSTISNQTAGPPSFERLEPTSLESQRYDVLYRHYQFVTAILFIVVGVVLLVIGFWHLFPRAVGVPTTATSTMISAVTSVVTMPALRGQQQQVVTIAAKRGITSSRETYVLNTDSTALRILRTSASMKKSSSNEEYYNPFARDNIVFDSGAEAHVCMDVALAQDIRNCRPGSLGGINAADSSVLRFNETCSFLHPRLTKAVLCKGAVANIVSPALAVDQGFIQEYLTFEDVYRLTHESGEGPVMRFGRAQVSRGERSRLYIMDSRTMDTPNLSLLSTPTLTVAVTVAHNKQKYTKREVAGADKALRFMDCIGQPTERNAIIQIRGTLNAPVTEADIRRCFDIYGKQMSSIKATAVKKPTAAGRTDTVPAAEVPIHVTMEVDIIFWKGRPFMLAILLPLDYAMGFPLANMGGRKAANIAAALKEFVAKTKSRNFTIDSISSDNEGGLAKHTTAHEIQNEGIELFFTGAGQHCPHIERRARYVKEKIRTHEHRLSYALNNSMLDWCVLAAVRETNLQITASSTANISPRQKFLGRAYDWKRDGRAPFGTYVQMTVRDTNNTATARAEGCLILIPRDNLTGSMWCYHISTGRIVVRDHFMELPMCDALIRHMDRLAAEDGHSHGSEPFSDTECGVPEETPEEIAATPLAAIPFKPHDQLGGVAVSPTVVAAGEAAAPRGGAREPAPSIPDVTRVGPGEAASSSRVTVEDVEEDEDEDEDDNDHTTSPVITDTVPATVEQLHGSRGVTQQQLNSLEPTSIPHGLPIITAPAHSTGAQLRGTRGANQSNSLASLHTNLTTGAQNFSEVGVDFQSAAFERKFDAQLVHTRHWRDRSFALVISWQRAIKTYGEPAARSIQSELQQMIDKGVWHPLSFKDMTKQQRLSAIRAKMFVTEKFFPNGIFDKIKSRLVARGDMQDRSLYGENDTSAPTAELSSVLSVAAIAACESRYVATCDIGGAFLNADMFKGNGRKVIVKLDKHVTKMLTKLKPDYESFIGDDGELFVELDKAMYGCIESAKLWYEHLRNVLVNDMGFSQNAFDQCTFNRTDTEGYQVTVIMHVDDMLITCANKCTLDGVLSALALQFPETKCHYGPCVPFLGMDMDFTAPGDVRITMEGAETNILATAGVIGDYKTSSPALENLFLVHPENEPVGQEDQDWFRSNVAKLLYLGKRARPEILTATSFLATRAAKADIDDLAKLRRVLRYIRDSPNRGIRLSPGAHGVNVRAYVDAAYGVHMDGKSHTGVSIMLGQAGPIFVRSTKQPIVAKSSTESELIATSDSANQVFHVRNFIIAQGHGDQPATIFQDNLSCMSLLAKGKSTSMRTRHIQIRYFWVKERVDNGEAVILHMRSEAMGPANALTKPLVGSQFIEERQQLTNWD
jgi:hypothetical protein